MFYSQMLQNDRECLTLVGLKSVEDIKIKASSGPYSFLTVKISLISFRLYMIDTLTSSGSTEFILL